MQLVTAINCYYCLSLPIPHTTFLLSFFFTPSSFPLPPPVISADLSLLFLPFHTSIFFFNCCFLCFASFFRRFSLPSISFSIQDDLHLSGRTAPAGAYPLTEQLHNPEIPFQG